MKNIILLIALTLGALQADSIVHYDTSTEDSSGISKPNYPNDDIHSGR